LGRDRAATGFGADLRQWLRLTATPTAALAGILAPDGGNATLQAEVTRLRAEGRRVVMRLAGDSSPASDFGCDQELVNKNGRWVVQPVK
jgi:ATP phosphoribosyltransferase regulatory subunit